MRRTARLAVAAGIALAAVPLGAGPAQAAPCSGTSGVTVVVDFGALGGVRTGCAPGDPSSGIAALNAAGFSATGTQQYGIAFVCRIAGLPTPAQDPCVRTPPTTAYWAYFHAARGGSWAYSARGASSYDPAPGSVEGWRFGSGSPPGIAPPAAPAPPPATTRPPTRPAPPPPAPAPTTRSSGPGAPAPGAPAPGNPAPGNPGPGNPAPGSPAAGDPAPGNPTAGPGSTRTGATGTTRPGATSRPPASATAGPTTSAGATTDPAAPGATTDPPSPTAEPASSSRGLTGSLIGAAVVAAVGLAAFLVIRRRRTTA